MKILQEIHQKEVWEYWTQEECWPRDVRNFRKDIADNLPNDLKWYLAEIEKEDLGKIFIISSDDWASLTANFRISEVSDSIEKGVFNKKVQVILQIENVGKRGSQCINSKLVLVASTIGGNFTIIEGNKRAVALFRLNELVGKHVFLGISNEIRGFLWARYTKGV